MSLENRLLSKVIDDNNYAELIKYNITEQDFTTQGDTFKFIKGYIKEFGEVPAFTTVVAECPSFEYEPEVFDNIGYMCKKVKADVAKRKTFTLLQKDATEKFSKMNGADFISWLHSEVTGIKETTAVECYAGANYATNGAERLAIYKDSKENRTYQYIPTPYQSLTEALVGGFELSDYVLLQSFSNKGKSWIASDIGVASWRGGFGVLHYSPELSRKQQLQRLDTLHGHFKNSALRIGDLKNEDKYEKYLESFNETNEIPYIVKTMGDMPRGLTLELIEADLSQNENIKMVIIDGFNLMAHRGKDGNRNNMSNTSRKLRQLFGKYGVVGIVVHQIGAEAERSNRTELDDGTRVPKPADITQYSETVAVVQDACVILNFDQVDGIGKILLAKSRTPNVGTEIDLHCNFDAGYITEADITDEF
jgi:replicative DNA helicase